MDFLFTITAQISECVGDTADSLSIFKDGAWAKCPTS